MLSFRIFHRTVDKCSSFRTLVVIVQSISCVKGFGQDHLIIRAPLLSIDRNRISLSSILGTLGILVHFRHFDKVTY